VAGHVYPTVKNLKQTTAATYTNALRQHVLPALGFIPLRRLTAQVIQDLLTRKLQGKQDKQGAWLERTLAPASVHQIHRVLHKALADAVRKGLLDHNPCERVDAPRRPRVAMRVWDEEQIRLFLAEAKRSSRFYRLYLAALTTGMRQGELLGLRWSDVDLTLAMAMVTQTFLRLGGRQVFSEPKSDRSRRTVALPPPLVEELRTLRDEQAEQRRLLGAAYQDRDLVFCQVDGRPLHAHNIARRDFRRVLELRQLREALRSRGIAEEHLPKPLPRIRFHDLRHCRATLGLKNGEHPKMVSELLGHSSVAFTMQVYSHVLPGMQAEAAARLEERLFGAKTV
jgi:integrase